MKLTPKQCEIIQEEINMEIVGFSNHLEEVHEKYEFIDSQTTFKMIVDYFNEKILDCKRLLK